MSAQNSSTQTPTQDTHSESDIHARLFPVLARVDWIQPLVAGINCTLWVAYGLWREKKDWPIVIANAPGIIFGGTAAITALM